MPVRTRAPARSMRWQQVERLRAFERGLAGEGVGGRPAIGEGFLGVAGAFGEEEAGLDALALAVERAQQLHRVVGGGGDVFEDGAVRHAQAFDLWARAWA